MATFTHFFANYPYLDALKIQEKYHSIVNNSPEDIYILGFEHPACITLGKNSSVENLLNSTSEIPVYKTERGGEVTIHEPGQLVIYPILNVSYQRLGARQYIRKLELCILESLKNFDIQAHTIPQYPGVWIESDRKIAAIGIRIKEKVSLHGAAINVSNNLRTFSHIVPCGIQGKSVTSIYKETNQNIPIEEFWNIFLGNFELIFETKISPQNSC